MCISPWVWKLRQTLDVFGMAKGFSWEKAVRNLEHCAQSYSFDEYHSGCCHCDCCSIVAIIVLTLLNSVVAVGIRRHDEALRPVCRSAASLRGCRAWRPHGGAFRASLIGSGRARGLGRARGGARIRVSVSVTIRVRVRIPLRVQVNLSRGYLDVGHVRASSEPI